MQCHVWHAWSKFNYASVDFLILLLQVELRYTPHISGIDNFLLEILVNKVKPYLKNGHWCPQGTILLKNARWLFTLKGVTSITKNNNARNSEKIILSTKEYSRIIVVSETELLYTTLYGGPVLVLTVTAYCWPAHVNWWRRYHRKIIQYKVNVELEILQSDLTVFDSTASSHSHQCCSNRYSLKVNDGPAGPRRLQRTFFSGDTPA